MAGRIKVISFDLWDTVFVDDSDEAKRSAAGLAAKPTARRDLVERFLAAAAGDRAVVSRALVDVAYATADAAFRRVWYGQSVTWSVRERLEVVLAGLGRELPEADLEELVRLHEEMEVEFMPDLVPGVCQAIADLAADYKLAVISDAIFSPGRCLRQILRNYDLERYFSAFVFSDEVGCSKPHPRCFEAIAEQIGCRTHEIVHLGDREAKDIDGPLAVGARGVLIPIAKDRGAGAQTRAAAVCRDYSELRGIIAQLDHGA